MSRVITLFLCGDVMTGRGVDQVMACPSAPVLHETWVQDARVYVQLAERAHGHIEQPVDEAYIWGAALGLLERTAPDACIVNLETSITRSGDYLPGKGINYRMHPANIGCLLALGIDCCVLANNHVLDWGYAGLEETLATLRAAGLRAAGAGSNAREAAAPAVVDLEKGRVLVFAFGTEGSGIPRGWGARTDRAGINLLTDLSDKSARRVAGDIKKHKRRGDIIVVSIHWGGNWGYEIPDEQRVFAHELIDAGVVDVVHGHSSHHAKGIEVYGEKPILYGCGDFLNDYEGIVDVHHEEYRGDLSPMYFLRLDGENGRLEHLEIVPLQTRRFSLQRASSRDVLWLRNTLDREGSRLGTRVSTLPDGMLALRWRGRDKR